MEDRVEIPIVTTADTKGAQQTAAALKEVEKATVAHGQANEEAAKKTEFLGQSHGELKKELRELGREFPLASQAARAFLNPLTAAITLGIGLFAKFKQQLDQWNEAMDRASEAAANPDFAAGIAKQKEVLQQGAVAQAQFEEGLRKIASAQDEVITRLGKTTDKIHEQMAAEAEINNASEAEELARINLSEKTGTMTPAAAIIARAGVNAKYQTLADQLKTRQENQELQEKQNALYQAQEDQPGLETEAAVRQRAADRLKGQVEKAKTDLPTAEANLKSANAEIAKLIEAYQEYEDSIADTYTIYDSKGHKQEFTGPNPAAQKVLQQKQAAIDDARARRDVYNHEVKQLRSFANRGDIDLVKAQGEAAQAQNAASTNAQGIETLSSQIDTARTSNATRQMGRGIASVFQSRASDADTFSQLASTDIGKMLMEGGREAHIMLAGRMAQNARDSGRPMVGGDQMISAAQTLSEAQNNVANQVATLLKNGNQSTDKILQLLESLINGQLSAKQRLDLLERMIRNVDSKQKFIGPS